MPSSDRRGASPLAPVTAQPVLASTAGGSRRGPPLGCVGAGPLQSAASQPAVIGGRCSDLSPCADVPLRPLLMPWRSRTSVRSSGVAGGARDEPQAATRRGTPASRTIALADCQPASRDRFGDIRAVRRRRRGRSRCHASARPGPDSLSCVNAPLRGPAGALVLRGSRGSDRPGGVIGAEGNG